MEQEQVQKSEEREHAALKAMEQEQAELKAMEQEHAAKVAVALEQEQELVERRQDSIKAVEAYRAGMWSQMARSAEADDSVHPAGKVGCKQTIGWIWLIYLL